MLLLLPHYRPQQPDDRNHWEWSDDDGEVNQFLNSALIFRRELRNIQPRNRVECPSGTKFGSTSKNFLFCRSVVALMTTNEITHFQLRNSTSTNPIVSR